MTTQEKIIHAFLNLLANNDYEQITITKIMGQCRLPRTYYYEFFDDKDDLAQEAFYTTMYPIFHLFAESFKPDGTINRQTATQGSVTWRTTAAWPNSCLRSRSTMTASSLNTSGGPRKLLKHG